MKEFLRKTAFLVLPWLVLAWPVDLLLTSSLKRTREYAGEIEVWNDIYAGRINADVLVYGSSRAWTHIDPGILEDSLSRSCYNLGMDGQTFWLEYFRHREYLKHNRKPRRILLSVDIYSLAGRGALFNKNQFLPYMLWNPDVRAATRPYIGFTSAEYVVPLLRYACNAKATVHAGLSLLGLTPPVPFRTKGYRPKDAPWSRDFQHATSRMEFFTAEVDSLSLRTFERFLDECRRDSIEVILVYTPEYIEGQRFIRNRGEVIERYRRYARKFDIEFLDYSSDPICSEKRYFFNATHLNKDGAETFTRKLAEDLTRLKDGGRHP